MDIKTAVETVVVKKYMTLDGRAPRSEYWWFVLAYIIIAIIAAVLDGALGLYIAPDVGLLSLVVWLALLIPSIAVAARRCHDLDKSGWWLLLVFIPLLGSLILLFFFVQRGTQGSNRFGPDPL